MPRPAKPRPKDVPSEVLAREDFKREVKRKLQQLGRRLREARQARGLTQEQAAEIMGLHPKSIPRLERGTANPTVSTLLAASVAYRVPLSGLLAESEDEDGGKR